MIRCNDGTNFVTDFACLSRDQLSHCAISDQGYFHHRPRSPSLLATPQKRRPHWDRRRLACRHGEGSSVQKYSDHNEPAGETQATKSFSFSHTPKASSSLGPQASPLLSRGW